VAGNTTLTLADQLSLLLDRTGYRAMLRESRAENMEQKLENLGELIDIAGGFHNAREFLDHAALATNRERGGDEDVVSLMTLHIARGDDGGLEGGQEDVRKLEPLGFVATREDTIVILNTTSAIVGAGVSTSSLASCDRRSHKAPNSWECISIPKLVSSASRRLARAENSRYLSKITPHEALSPDIESSLALSKKRSRSSMSSPFDGALPLSLLTSEGLPNWLHA
jgi:hypothetical protein